MQILSVTDLKSVCNGISESFKKALFILYHLIFDFLLFIIYNINILIIKEIDYNVKSKQQKRFS